MCGTRTHSELGACPTGHSSPPSPSSPRSPPSAKSAPSVVVAAAPASASAPSAGMTSGHRRGGVRNVGRREGDTARGGGYWLLVTGYSSGLLNREPATSNPYP